MSAFKDISGRRFHRLVAIERVGTTKANKAIWRCACDCGGEARTTTGSLLCGNAKSCGCYRVARYYEKAIKHGMAKTLTHSTWCGMIQRCTNPNSRNWHRYGGRGIQVCERWLKFENFLADVGEKPAGLSLDRIDNNRGYEPGNCRWATAKQQANNTSKQERKHGGHGPAAVICMQVFRNRGLSTNKIAAAFGTSSNFVLRNTSPIPGAPRGR